ARLDRMDHGNAAFQVPPGMLDVAAKRSGEGDDEPFSRRNLEWVGQGTIDIAGQIFIGGHVSGETAGGHQLIERGLFPGETVADNGRGVYGPGIGIEAGAEGTSPPRELAPVRSAHCFLKGNALRIGFDFRDSTLLAL